MRRRVAVVTGSRAEYGLLAPVITALRAANLDVRLIVTGSHLNRKQGLTVREIETDGHAIAARVPLGDSDNAHGTARAMARGLEGFSRAYERLKPQLIVVLGDRFEILAAAAAALPHRIPVAHLHGGESTEGAWDESIRHALTKLSHLHFPASPFYAMRIKRMGEDPRRVFCFGSPAWDRLAQVPRLSRPQLERELGMPLINRPLGLVTYHPATLSADRGSAEFRALLSALDRRSGTWIFTCPNADAGSAAIRRYIEAFVTRHPARAAAFHSLGQKLYFSLLAHVDVMLGNSSSGLLEAPFFALPVVNVGDRQAGRLRERNVIDVPQATAAAVARALNRALSKPFRRSLRPARLAAKGPSRRIAETLRRVVLDESLLKKRFHG